MTVKLVAREVAKAALARYEARTLSAQAPRPICRYRTTQRGTVYACAIGAGLSDADWRRIRAANWGWPEGTQNAPLEQLKGWVADNGFALKGLQAAHDQWANANAQGGGPGFAESRRDAFLSVARKVAQ